MILGRGDAGSDGLRLAVDGGRVACPQDGDVDIERCYVCGYLDDVDEPERPRAVTCRWRGSLPHGPVDQFDHHWRPTT
jgi:hypothetical protein